jgi:hypothetical protein
MSDEQRTVTAAKYKAWYEKLVEIWQEDPKNQATGNRATVASLLHTLDRIGRNNEAMESRVVGITDPAGGVTAQRQYRLKSDLDFDWKNGVIVIGSASWADVTGDEGFIAEVVRATGISEED